MSEHTMSHTAPESDFERDSLENPVYQNLLMDDAFKRVFGEEGNEELMKGLIQAVLPELQIVSLSYIANQAPHQGKDTKKSIYDVRCKLADGTHIIVEIQRKKQNYFEERMLYYGLMPLTAQIKNSEEYRLDPVYVICFTDFLMEHGTEWKPKMKSHYLLKEKANNEILTDKLQMIFVELPRLTKQLRDCVSFEEKLYFCIRHIFRLRSQPDELGGEYFDSLFKESALANLTAEELEQYNRTMTTERDIRNQIKYAQEQSFEAGKAEGIEETKLNNAKQFKAAGVTLETIAACTGLDIETVKAL